MRKELILFVGSNPSNACPLGVAFHEDTKSAKILAVWTKCISCKVAHINVTDQATPNNRALTSKEITASLPALAESIRGMGTTKVVALGKTAAKALTLLQVAFYEMPHPSGMNRMLNDPKFVEEKIKGLLEYANKKGNHESGSP